MMTEHLSDTVLNTLADLGRPPEPGSAEAEHLAACESCRAELQAMLELDATAARLPRSIEPSRDLWPGIAQRIAERGVVPIQAARSARWAGAGAGRAGWTSAGWGWFTSRPLLAAAMVLLAFSGLALLVRFTGDGVPGPAIAMSEAVPTAFAAFAPSEAEYLQTADELRRELEARRDRLEPATIATVEANLLIVEQALNEARNALLADPANRELTFTLASGYQAKIELLAEAIRLTET